MEFAKASKLIQAVQELMNKHGDLPICADDPDTDWRLPIGVVYKEKNADYPERLEIKTSYMSDVPKGAI